MTNSQLKKIVDDVFALNLQLTYLNMLVLRISFAEGSDFKSKIIYEIESMKEKISKIKQEIQESL